MSRPSRRSAGTSWTSQTASQTFRGSTPAARAWSAVRPPTPARTRVLLSTRPAGQAVVVDDVVTTGATVSESVRVLQTAGTDVVAVLALAHA